MKSNKKRILYFINTFSVGGIEKHLTYISTAILKSKLYDVHIGYLRKEDGSTS